MRLLACSRRYELYRITFPNGKIYIGYSSDSDRRFREHIRASQREDTKLYRAIRKFGSDSLLLDTLAVGSRYYITKLEGLAVYKFRTMDSRFGYNTIPGGNISPMHSAAIVRLVSKAKTGKHYPNLSFSLKGKPKSLVHRARLALANTGKKQSADLVERRVASLRGRPRSAEVREKISVAKTGKPNGTKGILKSLAHRMKISVAMQGKRLSAETIAKRTASWRANRNRENSGSAI